MKKTNEIYEVRNYNYKGEYMQFEFIDNLPKVGDKDENDAAVEEIKEVKFGNPSFIKLFFIYYDNDTCDDVALDMWAIAEKEGKTLAEVLDSFKI